MKTQFSLRQKLDFEEPSSLNSAEHFTHMTEHYQMGNAQGRRIRIVNVTDGEEGVRM